MKIKCKDCDEVETFESTTEAKENDWHKVGAIWICDSCWEEDYADSDDEDEDDDDDDDSFTFSRGDSSFNFGGGSFGGGGSSF
jgi:uncharacterized membrane protein YgcG